MIDHELLGDSAAIAGVIRFIGKTAPTDSAVLIQGETGTGKELVARALHRNSRRAAGPFVAINCAALQESLLESGLFGHERGAFTGASARQLGKFELAAGGTLFLDEIGEISPSIQAKLLRALQEREIDRVGGRAPIPINVRLVAATNCDLKAEALARRFRHDLYYRLNTVCVTTPPLRERPEDIPILARHAVAESAREMAVPLRSISSDADFLLRRYSWPGNVRELQNAIAHAMILGSGQPVIAPTDLPDYVMSPAPQTLDEAVAKAKRDFVARILGLVDGSSREAAQMLGRHPKGFQRLLRSLNLPSQKTV